MNEIEINVLDGRDVLDLSRELGRLHLLTRTIKQQASILIASRSVARSGIELSS
jgi:hypothetical protein